MKLILSITSLSTPIPHMNRYSFLNKTRSLPLHNNSNRHILCTGCITITSPLTESELFTINNNSTRHCFPHQLRNRHISLNRIRTFHSYSNSNRHLTDNTYKFTGIKNIYFLQIQTLQPDHNLNY